MQDFEYRRVRAASEAAALLREDPSAKLLAGGQSLLASMRMGLLATDLLIDLQDVQELRNVENAADGSVVLGAMMTHGALASHPELRSFAPGLAELAGGIADAQVRSMGTIGGSLANADPSACWSAGVLALGGEIHTSERAIPVDAYFMGMFATALAPDEVLARVRLRRPRRFCYLKHEQAASRFAMVGVAVADFGDAIRVAVNGTADGAVRAPAFEQALQRRLDPESLRGVRFDESLMTSDIHAGADYRAHMAGVLCRRAVARMLVGAPG
jgi:aerobic carbon-monoxide dehydrogenase medium subunit